MYCTGKKSNNYQTQTVIHHLRLLVTTPIQCNISTYNYCEIIHERTHNCAFFVTMLSQFKKVSTFHGFAALMRATMYQSICQDFLNSNIYFHPGFRIHSLDKLIRSTTVKLSAAPSSAYSAALSYKIGCKCFCSSLQTRIFVVRKLFHYGNITNHK